MRRSLLAMAIAPVLLAAAAACGDSPTSPSSDAPADDAITTPVTVSFAGVIGPNGTASRRFTAQLPGTAVLSISGIAPAAALIVGLGIPRADGGGCLLARSPTAVDGGPAQVTAHVDSGEFCTQVLGPPDAPGPVGFTLTLEHP
jgi:hypothetical protein